MLPGTFEMGALRVEWETRLILRSSEPMRDLLVDRGRYNLLPRRPDEARKLVYALRYTGDSVRELKRRYGYKTERWHATASPKANSSTPSATWKAPPHPASPKQQISPTSQHAPEPRARAAS